MTWVLTIEIESATWDMGTESIVDLMKEHGGEFLGSGFTLPGPGKRDWEFGFESRDAALLARDEAVRVLRLQGHRVASTEVSTCPDA